MKVVWLVRTRTRDLPWRHRYACTRSNDSIGSTIGDNPPPLIHKTRAEAENTARLFQSRYGMYEEAKVVARRVDEAAGARAAFDINMTYSAGDAQVTMEAFRAVRDQLRRSR